MTASIRSTCSTASRNSSTSRSSSPTARTRHPVPPAGDHPSVRARTTRGARRHRRDPAPSRAVVRASSSPAPAAGSHGPDEPEWVTRIDRELDNLRAAITWATGANDVDLAMELLGEVPAPRDQHVVRVHAEPMGSRRASSPWRDRAPAAWRGARARARPTTAATTAPPKPNVTRAMRSTSSCGPEARSRSFPGECSSRSTRTQAMQRTSSLATTSS